MLDSTVLQTGCLCTAAAWPCLQAEETGKPLPKLETVLHVDAASSGLPPPEQTPASPAASQPANISKAPPQAPACSSYKGAVAPQNEAERLSVLKGLGVLEEVPDLHLDRICEALVQLFKVAPAPASALHCLLLCSLTLHQTMPHSHCNQAYMSAAAPGSPSPHSCGAMQLQVPVALVSLVDAERQFFKSAAGPVGAKMRCTSTDRDVSFCAWTLLPEHAQMLIVEDATKDAR